MNHTNFVYQEQAGDHFCKMVLTLAYDVMIPCTNCQKMVTRFKVLKEKHFHQMRNGPKMVFIL